MSNSKDFSHIKPALANGSKVQLAHAWRGEPVVATGRPNSPGDNVQQAMLWSTAPYVPPKPKSEFGPRGCKGKGGECKAPGIAEYGLCVFHARQAGVYNAWDEEVPSSTLKD